MLCSGGGGDRGALTLAEESAELLRKLDEAQAYWFTVTQNIELAHDRHASLYKLDEASALEA